MRNRKPDQAAVASASACGRCAWGAGDRARLLQPCGGLTRAEVPWTGHDEVMGDVCCGVERCMREAGRVLVVVGTNAQACTCVLRELEAALGLPELDGGTNMR